MTYAAVFTPEAEYHLEELHRYIADAATPETAATYVDAIITLCEGLAIFHAAVWPAITSDPAFAPCATGR